MEGVAQFHTYIEHEPNFSDPEFPIERTYAFMMGVPYLPAGAITKNVKPSSQDANDMYEDRAPLRRT